MITLGSQLVVIRGEVFVIKRSVTYKNGVPFTLDSALENQYILITVSSNTYRLEGRYIKRYWLDLSEYPKFDTREVKDLTKEQFEGNTLPPDYTATQCIFKYVSDSGEVGYYYYKDSKYQTYSFTFSKTFLNVDTREWIESKYQYEIQVVNGQSTRDYLTNTFEALFPDTVVPDTLQELYDAIYKVRPDLLKYVSVDAPIVNFETNTIIVPPSIIVVKANA